MDHDKVVSVEMTVDDVKFIHSCIAACAFFHPFIITFRLLKFGYTPFELSRCLGEIIRENKEAK